MNDTNFTNRESAVTPIRDENQHLLPFQENIRMAVSNSPPTPYSCTLSGNRGDSSPLGTYYATLQSTSSHRYANLNSYEIENCDF